MYLNNSTGISLITHSKALKCLVYLRRLQVPVNLFFHRSSYTLNITVLGPIYPIVQIYGPHQKLNTNKQSQSNLI